MSHRKPAAYDRDAARTKFVGLWNRRDPQLTRKAIATLLGVPETTVGGWARQLALPPRTPPAPPEPRPPAGKRGPQAPKAPATAATRQAPSLAVCDAGKSSPVAKLGGRLPKAKPVRVTGKSTGRPKLPPAPKPPAQEVDSDDPTVDAFGRLRDLRNTLPPLPSLLMKLPWEED